MIEKLPRPFVDHAQVMKYLPRSLFHLTCLMMMMMTDDIDAFRVDYSPLLLYLLGMPINLNHITNQIIPHHPIPDRRKYYHVNCWCCKSNYEH